MEFAVPVVMPHWGVSVGSALTRPNKAFLVDVGTAKKAENAVREHLASLPKPPRPAEKRRRYEVKPPMKVCSHVGTALPAEQLPLLIRIFETEERPSKPRFVNVSVEKQSSQYPRPVKVMVRK
jgi:hypothetical protein